MQKLTDTFTLSNGIKIPCVGYGTWRTGDDSAAQAVRLAVEAGYRHVDTAAIYNNERGVGEGIRTCGVDRKELFVTSKVWNTERGYDDTVRAFGKTLLDLGLDYLDLYLIHWPATQAQRLDWIEVNLSTWRALTDLYKDGKIRAIGVSNFLPHHLQPLMQAEVKPMVNQIEFHPGYMQLEAVNFCSKNGVLVEAWSPLGRGVFFDNSTLKGIADRYGKSVAQISLRWCLQHGVLPLPKSVTPDRITENANIFDFEISKDDMSVIDGLPYLGGSGLHPDTMKSDHKPKS